MEAQMPCPDEAALDDFARGRLRGGALGAIELHLDACAICRDVVVVLAGGDPDASGSAPSEPGLARGAELGRHRVVEAIGEGAMGRVYLGHDATLGRRVALKVLRRAADFASTTRSRAHAAHEARVLREAQALARLSHPNVVAVYEAGRSEAGVFLAMEYVAGGTLRSWLAAEPRGVERICDAFAQVGAGLAAAHAAGLVHRDVKPDNVLVGDDGRVRVTDFGLATADAATAESGLAALDSAAAAADTRLAPADSAAADIAVTDPASAP
ncbi:MAG TPA: serine/threonine-protein kinase, partial [Polyangiaceae bacterium]|nr:serine/threonine-protein kinase [Polyangiaceae bacterium]